MDELKLQLSQKDEIISSLTEQIQALRRVAPTTKKQHERPSLICRVCVIIISIWWANIMFDRQMFVIL